MNTSSIFIAIIALARDLAREEPLLAFLTAALTIFALSALTVYALHQSKERERIRIKQSITKDSTHQETEILRDPEQLQEDAGRPASSEPSRDRQSS